MHRGRESLTMRWMRLLRCRLLAAGAATLVLAAGAGSANASTQVDSVGGWVDGGRLPTADWHASLSADGRYVAFDSVDPLVWADTNLHTDVYVEDRETGLIRRVSVAG